ncbi:MULTISPECIES: efflux transporter outer membrane subunit [Pseudomonas]|uniref:efflux transporter outer membrane subunit n=1 Tax=Pseudomonas TaxID=286 RepID=UPI00300BE3CC
MLRHFVNGLAFLCSVAFFTLLTGCIGSHGISPQERLVGDSELMLDAAIESANKDAAWPSAQWWSAYADPQLNHWVSLALENSPTLGQAAARVRMALSQAGLAVANESPQLSAHASLLRRKWPTDKHYGAGDLADTTTWDNNTDLGFSYAFDFWGRNRSESERFTDLAYMSAAEAQMVQLELVSNIVRVYIQLSLQYAELDIAKSTLQQQQEILSIAKRRFAGGLGPRLEIVEAQMALPETERKIEAIDQGIVLTRNQIAALAGKGPGAGSVIKRPALSLGVSTALPTAVPLELVGHRPDVVAARWKIAAQAKGMDVARADFYPNVDLVATLGFSAVGGGVLEYLTKSKFNYNAGPAISLPIFDAGRRRQQYGYQTATYDAAVGEYNQTIVNALKGISDQLIRFNSLSNQHQHALKAVEYAEAAFSISTKAFRGGLTGYLNVLNAQSKMFQQRIELRRVEAGLLKTQADLVVALGGGVPIDQYPMNSRVRYIETAKHERSY